MLNSNSTFFGRPPDQWDTSYARKFLQIPKDELKLFHNISEKSTSQQKVGQNHSSKDELCDQIAEKLEKSKEEDQLHTSIETSNIKVALVHTSDLLQKKRPDLPLNAEKHQTTDTVLGARSRTIEITSVISPPGVQTLEGISFNMSTEHHTNSKSDKLQLNTTYTVPTVLDDKTNSIQSTSDEPSKKRIVEKLASQVSNQPIMEDPSTIKVPKFGGLPVFATNPVQMPVDRENFLCKKLKLLEKRFSPSKEFSLASPSEENLKPKCYLKNDRIQKMTISTQESDDMVSQVKISSPNGVYEEINSSNVASSSDGEKATFPCTQNPEKAISTQKLTSNIQTSKKKHTEEITLKSSTSVFEEESFISQPFPCGQPPSNTQFSTKSLPNKPETQLPIECQGADLTEKTNTPPDVFYEKCSGQNEVDDAVPVKETGGKRKRKSKGDKPSKKLLNTISLVCIQYTEKQVQDMIEIIKNFQLEKTNCI